MSNEPLSLTNLDQARAHAARTTCPNCNRMGIRSAYQVNNEGPNYGRLFLKCRHCGRFDWVSPPLQGSTQDEDLSRAQQQATPCPKCNKTRRALRVKKAGPNQGRLFLTCSDPGCDSFQWATPPNPQTVQQAPEPRKPRTTADGFLADIQDHPEDDTLRLIYADWLEDQNEPERAELIRLQCQHARLAPGKGDSALVRRIQQLILEHGPRWAQGVESIVHSYTFRRGLLEHVEISADTFAKQGEELLRTAPTILSLHVSVGGWRGIKTLVSTRALRQIQQLTLTGDPGGGAGARILAESPQVAGLRSVSLRGHMLGRPGVQALALSRYLARLEYLDLSENQLGRSTLAILASSPQLSRVKTLKLADNLLTSTDLSALTHGHMEELVSLDVSGNGITPDGIESLAGSALAGRLIELTVGGVLLGSSGARALASAGFRQLKCLSFQHADIQDGGAVALARAPWRLEFLSLRDNQLTNACIPALVRSPALASLKCLDLAENSGITEEGAQWLADWAKEGNRKVIGLSTMGG